ncbi:response regulator [uncultured Desulfosarcina sp.]|uniref:response regulator n=1 Tax=uncultured Desulfosarcina sp. TaxID=218289 RepID=UPI0029C8287E|nr:response regulator [uncultured Desulfosarcina sp.]
MTNTSTPTDAGFAGTLKNIQLNDLIQMCCLSGSSLCMRVNKDDRLGTIFIVDGEIIHADCEGVVGEEAFYQILCWQTGSFESIETSTTPERTIHQNYHFLIMEAARRVDEASLYAEEDFSPGEDSDEDHLRVLIVDDSPMMRKILSSMLTTSGSRIKVVGMAGNGKEAISLIDELSPDLVTLDVNMPVMDGTSTIKHIMIKKPCPVVITSNPGEGSSKAIFNFLELGAVDFMSKPTKSQDILTQQQKILERVRIAATANVGNFHIPRIPKAKDSERFSHPTEGMCHRLIIVVSGPGGHPEQIRLLHDLVPVVTDSMSSVVAILSLPSLFADAFASYLKQRCRCPASPIDKQRSLAVGHCYVGIHGCPLKVKMNAEIPTIGPADAESSAEAFPLDRLLTTAAALFKQRLTVVLLSGAGTGEQEGLRLVHESGGRIILQERVSAMVAKPLDAVVEAGLADMEVRPADLVRAVQESLVQQARTL